VYDETKFKKWKNTQYKNHVDDDRRCQFFWLLELSFYDERKTEMARINLYRL